MSSKYHNVIEKLKHTWHVLMFVGNTILLLFFLYITYVEREIIFPGVLMIIVILCLSFMEWVMIKNLEE